MIQTHFFFLKIRLSAVFCVKHTQEKNEDYKECKAIYLFKYYNSFTVCFAKSIFPIPYLML